jgi:hypothetical protein
VIRKNIKFLNKDLQVLYQSVEFNKKFKTTKIYIGPYKTINIIFKNNLNIKSRPIKIFYYRFESLIKSFENIFIKSIDKDILLLYF